MKKKILLLTLLSFLVQSEINSVLSEQNNYNGGGYKGPTKIRKINSIKDILLLGRKADDRHVKLTGYIIEALRDEKYTFKDKTGLIQIEIENEIWQGLSVDDKQEVVIEGEVDKGIFKLEVEVDKIYLNK